MKGVPLRPPKLRFPMAELVSPPWFWIWAEATFFKSCSPRLVINLLPPVNSWLGKPGWESAQGGQVTQRPPGRGWDGALALPQSSTHHPQTESLRGPMGWPGPPCASTHGALPGLSQARPALRRRQVDFVPPGRRRRCLRCQQRPRPSPERAMAGR